jgi:hypothetical protein
VKLLGVVDEEASAFAVFLQKMFGRDFEGFVDIFADGEVASN